MRPSAARLVLVSAGVLLSVSLGRAEPPRDPAPKKAPVRLTVGAFRDRRETAGGAGAAVGVGATLTVPLDKVAARTEVRPTPRDTPEVPPAEPPPGVATGELRDELRISASAMKALARAAWRAAGVSPEDDSLDRIATRARASAVLPELRLRALRTVDESARFAPTDGDPFRTYAYGGTGARMEIRLTWRLDRLVFAGEEIPLERLRAERAEQRTKVLARLLEHVLSWQRARARAALPKLTDEERVDALAREVAAEAALDAMTDGAWSSRGEDTTRRVTPTD